VTFDADLLMLSRPDHVDQDEWGTCLARYSAALALYKKAVTAISYQLAADLRPTEAQYRAEDAAQDTLVIARTALLDLAHDQPY